ncbi:MAG: serine hydrolase [Lachnospiraceae bacterium]|nr:serine hydrolase [Lachnospiraceae bacterium]
MQVCRKCGAALRDSDKYCSQCGARAPSAGVRARKERAQKKKQQKEITFRTQPEKGTHYRENFEEGENRRSALRVTVTILILMMLAVAGFAGYYLYNRGSSSRNVSAGRDGASIEILTEGSTSPSGAEEAEEPANVKERDDAPKIVGQEDAGAKEEESETAAQEAVVETEVQTEAQTEPQTEPPTPVAAEAIDVSQIQTLLASGSTATSAEVYIYDLKHDSEVAVNDCTVQLRLSAMITVPILYTAASRIDAGDLSMDTEITYVTTIGGRGEIPTEPRDGKSYPLSFYLQTMVNYSDNNCINILIDFLGLDSINSVCQEAGYTSVWLERGLVASGDTGGLDNYGSAKDITLMIRDLYTGKFSSVGADFMKEYFHIAEGDSLPTVIGLAPSVADASLFLNQNGHIDTRYLESAVIGENGAEYILTIMLNGDGSLVYNPAVQDIAEYVSTVMAP